MVASWDWSNSCGLSRSPHRREIGRHPVAVVNVNGNRALAFVVVLHLTRDARALIVERGLEDASWRMPWVALPVG
jgi:hypothetical protein